MNGLVRRKQALTRRLGTPIMFQWNGSSAIKSKKQSRAYSSEACRSRVSSCARNFVAFSTRTAICDATDVRAIPSKLLETARRQPEALDFGRPPAAREDGHVGAGRDDERVGGGGLDGHPCQIGSDAGRPRRTGLIERNQFGALKRGRSDSRLGRRAAFKGKDHSCLSLRRSNSGEAKGMRPPRRETGR
jgi:hypothetical protein